VVDSNRVYRQKSNNSYTFLNMETSYYDGRGNLRKKQSLNRGVVINTQYHFDDLSRVIYSRDTNGNISTVNYNS